MVPWLAPHLHPACGCQAWMQASVCSYAVTVVRDRPGHGKIVEHAPSVHQALCSSPGIYLKSSSCGFVVEYCYVALPRETIDPGYKWHPETKERIPSRSNLVGQGFTELLLVHRDSQATTPVKSPTQVNSFSHITSGLVVQEDP